jgi:recombination protein RecR
MEYPSKLVEQAVEAFASLPGIGRKTALRLTLHLLKQSPDYTRYFTDALAGMRAGIRRCSNCGNLCDAEICSICASPRRDRGQICVVAEVQDVLAIEKTGHYNGLYHVLDGLISPLEGISPDDLRVPRLLERARFPETREVIFALSSSMEGETTAFYLARQLAGLPVQVSSLARGIPMGSELEYTDELTIARSLQQRTHYQLPGGE